MSVDFSELSRNEVELSTIEQSVSWTANSHFTGEKCSYSEFFWSVFSRIRSEYGPE